MVVVTRFVAALLPRRGAFGTAAMPPNQPTPGGYRWRLTSNSILRHDIFFMYVTDITLHFLYAGVSVGRDEYLARCAPAAADHICIGKQSTGYVFTQRWKPRAGSCLE